MDDWASGYVTEVEYTHGYFRELSPPILNLALLNRGIRVNQASAGRYLELGFGQGLSLNIHAAACEGEYWGIDFNPAHAANAQAMARAAGAEARALEMSFAELAARDDLPEFDIIVLHGIWSWISDENRAAIIDIARRKLASGGVFYLSYNCGPGWSATAPLRHLIALHADTASAPSEPMSTRVDAALKFAQELNEAGAIYFKQNPAGAERLKRLTQQDRRYIAHEYLNRNWQIMQFADVCDDLSNAKLEYATSATLSDHVDDLNLTAESVALLDRIQNLTLRETVRDYFTNQQFRRDIFVKGRRRLQQPEQVQDLLDTRFALLSPPSELKFNVVGVLGAMNLQEDLCRSLADILSEDGYEPKTLRTILERPEWASRGLAVALKALLLLAASGQATPAQSPDTTLARQPYCARLNLYICNQARYSGELTYLASPVIGGAVVVSRIQQLFLLAIKNGRPAPKDWAEFAWPILAAQNQRLIKDGKTLESAEDNLAALCAQAEAFAQARYPLLKGLYVVL